VVGVVPDRVVATLFTLEVVDSKDDMRACVYMCCIDNFAKQIEAEF